MCIRVCVPVEMGVRSRFWELQTVELNANPLIKETVCGYLGKKCLGMRWGGGGVGYGAQKQGPITEDISPF